MTAHPILTEAKKLGEYIVYCRRTLHAIAETGFDTTRTLAFIEGELRLMAIEPQSCGRAGLTALIGGGEKCLLLRADVDALPIPEESGLEFAAKNGCSHACGHDTHAAMLLGAAKILKKHERELKCRVKLMFQSAEELLEGAKDMLDAGVLEDPPVSAAMMLHVMTASPLPAGTVIVPPAGVSAPAADYFTVELRGRGCHGSSPNTGIDPITAAAQLILALQEIPARELGMQEAAVLTVGSVHGGEAANAIPDSVIMGGTLRAMEEETREYVKSRLAEISKGIADAFRCEAEVRFGSGCPGLVNEGALAAFAERCARESLGGDRVLSAADFSAAGGRGGRTAGSEDFAYISRRVPSLMLALAAGETEKGFINPLHHPAVRFDEAALPYGAAVLAFCAMEWGKHRPFA